MEGCGFLKRGQFKYEATVKAMKMYAPVEYIDGLLYMMSKCNIKSMHFITFLIDFARFYGFTHY